MIANGFASMGSDGRHPECLAVLEAVAEDAVKIVDGTKPPCRVRGRVDRVSDSSFLL